jgi:hypothetical protein
MGIDSINEPGQRTTMLTPASINEPLTLPEGVGAPVIDSIDPASAVIGEADFTLFVTGSGFFAGSVIYFAGRDEPTTLNEDGTLSTGVNMSVWLGPDTVPVTVRNGPLTSNEVDFTFSAAGTRTAAHTVDPDDMEEEIEQAEEEGDFKPMHKAKSHTAHKRKK